MEKAEADVEKANAEKEIEKAEKVEKGEENVEKKTEVKIVGNFTEVAETSAIELVPEHSNETKESRDDTVGEKKDSECKVSEKCASTSKMNTETRDSSDEAKNVPPTPKVDEG